MHAHCFAKLLSFAFLFICAKQYFGHLAWQSRLRRVAFAGILVCVVKPFNQTNAMKSIITIATLAVASSLSAAEPVKMNPVPAETLDFAANKIDKTFLRFRYDLKGGGHIWGSDVIGRLLVMSLASYLGEPAEDEKFLAQIRFLLDGKNAISANGGYPSQHNHVFLCSLLVARETPSIWKRFTGEEKKKIDLLFKAELVGCAYTTSDVTYADGAKPTTIDGDTNLHRAWNPNFREGMVGGLITGACWLGPKEAQAFLDKYDHVKFVEELRAAGLSNTYDIFTKAISNPESGAPDAERINKSLRGFRYLEQDIAKPMDLYIGLAEHTYGAVVSSGLNNGAGKDGGGKIVKNADAVQNIGKKGMLWEFASMDGRGPRSCAIYSYTGFRPNLAKQIAMIVSGHFDSKHPKWKETLELVKIGNEDLFVKLENGYISYSHGRNHQNDVSFTDKDDKGIMRDLWNKTLLPYYAKQVK